MDAPTPHPHIEPLVGLLGMWRGQGAGRYPTIPSFSYDEELRFWHTGRPWVGYEQRTQKDGSPAHNEVGYWRPYPDGHIELVLAHAFGIAEVQEGRIEGAVIEVRSTTLASTRTANVVEAVARTFWLDGDTLRYEVRMAFGDQPLQNHLEATLQRVMSSD
jgi:hypothetical protein